MALIRANTSGGGGSSIDIASPDVQWNGTIAGNSSQSVSVTKKPRYGILTCYGSVANTFLINFEKETIIRTHGTQYSTDYATVVRAVTSSVVTLATTSASAQTSDISLFY